MKLSTMKNVKKKMFLNLCVLALQCSKQQQQMWHESRRAPIASRLINFRVTALVMEDQIYWLCGGGDRG